MSGCPGMRVREESLAREDTLASVKEASQEGSLRIGGNPTSPRQAPRGERGDQMGATQSGFSCHLASPPFPAPPWRPQKIIRKWEHWASYILIILTPSLQRGWHMKEDILTLKGVESFDYYRSFIGLRWQEVFFCILLSENEQEIHEALSRFRLEGQEETSPWQGMQRQSIVTNKDASGCTLLVLLL